MFSRVEETISAIASPVLQQKLLFLKIIFLIVSAGLMGGIIYFIRNSRWWEFFYPRQQVEAFGIKSFEKRRVERGWEKTKKRLDSEISSEHKLAVIEADNLLNSVLERMGYPGENLAEKLKKVPEGTLPNLEEIWTAHGVRNNIVHDPNYKISQEETKKIVEVYEKTFEHLEVF